jgi:GTP:adenosylcobinamide-phosphate guanylyltransferase
VEETRVVIREHDERVAQAEEAQRTRNVAKLAALNSDGWDSELVVQVEKAGKILQEHAELLETYQTAIEAKAVKILESMIADEAQWVSADLAALRGSAVKILANYREACAAVEDEAAIATNWAAGRKNLRKSVFVFEGFSSAEAKQQQAKAAEKLLKHANSINSMTMTVEDQEDLETALAVLDPSGTNETYEKARKKIEQAKAEADA